MFILVAFTVAASGSAPIEWKTLAAGIERGEAVLEAKPEFCDGKLQIVRIDPAQTRFAFALASETANGEARTAADWLKEKSLSVGINAGMFDQDQRSNVGHLANGTHINQAKWKAADKSLFIFDPIDPRLPRAQIIDADTKGAMALVGQYRSVVQNLRLIKGDSNNVWKPNGRRWSEAMIAQDRAGRILFLFARSPYEMADLNNRILALPLGITRAMHVGGGPEASLSIHIGGISSDAAGSYETGFRTDDSNTEQWPIPNVLGVRAAPAK